jgi:hypothetical protein
MREGRIEACLEAAEVECRLHARYAAANSIAGVP